MTTVLKIRLHYWVMAKLISSILFVLLIMGCSQGLNSANELNDKKLKYTPLSLEDSKKLITPTVYFIPQFDQAEENHDCLAKIDMKTKRGTVIVSVCKSTYDSCVLQGTCLIKKADQKFLINVASKVNGERRFSNITNSHCTYGLGATQDHIKSFSSMCLDPYYSVAADLSIYRLGAVIFVPSFAGVLLPNGVVHDGYFVVRDTGNSIKGYGRFDFFSGFDSYKNKTNPLVFQGFMDKRTHVPYFLIEGPKAVEILESRLFPSIVVSK